MKNKKLLVLAITAAVPFVVPTREAKAASVCVVDSAANCTDTTVRVVSYFDSDGLSTTHFSCNITVYGGVHVSDATSLATFLYNQGLQASAEGFVACSGAIYTHGNDSSQIITGIGAVSKTAGGLRMRYESAGPKVAAIVPSNIALYGF